MFLDYYNLVEQPFGVTPDPRFLYLNHMYSEALASLWCGVKQGRGFLTLVAPPGTGKTTLLFQLLQRLRISSARTVFLFQTCCDSADLIRYLLLDLSIFPAPDLASMHQQLNEALAREARAGRQLVFVIDEAQNLSEPVLETIRLLSDFETPQGKLLQIVLSGQPQLLRVLLKPEMLQLRQRISALSSLHPLPPEEIPLYVDHRLRMAGHKGASLFSRGALQVIARESQGIPRNINNLCFGALATGFALRRQHIDRDIVEEVAADQNLQSYQEKIQNEAARSWVPTRDLASSSVTPSPHPHLWVSRRARPAAYLAGVAGLLLLAGLFTWSKKPGLASHLFAKSMPVTVSTDLSRQRAPLQMNAAVEAVDPAREPHPPAIFPKPRVVMVKGGDDLRHICLLYLGRYSTRVVQQVQALNPELRDPNHIEVGQRLLLPQIVEATNASSPAAEKRQLPNLAALDK